MLNENEIGLRQRVQAEKVEFVKNLSPVLSEHIRNIEKIEYDVFDNGNEEYIVITFVGGAISVRNSYANSCYAILEEITRMCMGGYYDEVPYYKSLKARKGGE